MNSSPNAFWSRCAIALVLAVPPFATESANAQGLERFWNDDQSGGTYDFTDPFNWVDGSTLGIPGAEDTAIIDIPWFMTVTFPTPQATDRVIIRGGLVEFDLAEAPYSLLNQGLVTPSIVVGDLIPAAPSLAITGGPLTGGFVDVGQTAGAFGMLSAVGPTSSLLAQMHLHVGHDGIGFMDLADGGAASCDRGTVALGSGSAGQVTVTGAGSLWDAPTALTVAQGGFGLMTIEDQGAVTSGDGIIAQQIGSYGSVNVDGPGSSWAIAGTLDVGLVGHGSLSITGGASVTNDVFAVIGTAASSQYPQGELSVGEVRVEGAGSSWTINGDLYIGFVGFGTLIASSGGTVTIDGDLIRGPWGFDQIIIELAGSADYPTAALAATGLADGFEVQVDLVDGFVPEVGDVFVIASAGVGFVNFFGFDLPSLPADRTWSILQSTNIVELHVIQFVQGDLNGDGVVDTLDLLALLTGWGACPPPPAECPADLNGDGVVDVVDLLVLLQNWTP